MVEELWKCFIINPSELLYHVVEELSEGSPVLLLFEPESVEVQTQGGPVSVIMAPGEKIWNLF